MTQPGVRRPLLSDQIRDEILEAILNGRIEVGERIPPEPELCHRFGVSRTTVREAVRSLVESGYLKRVHGSGTFVSFRPSLTHTLDRNLSYSRMIESAGFKLGYRLLEIERTTASETEQTRLRLDEDAGVVRVRRVRSADQRPVIYSRDAMPLELVGSVTDQGFEGSFYEMLSKLGHSISYAEATLSPVMADDDLGTLLDVEAGDPLLRITQVDFNSEGIPVIFSQEWHVPDIFEMTLIRRSV